MPPHPAPGSPSYTPEPLSSLHTPQVSAFVFRPLGFLFWTQTRAGGLVAGFPSEVWGAPAPSRSSHLGRGPLRKPLALPPHQVFGFIFAQS